jgi:hypothetical protein
VTSRTLRTTYLRTRLELRDALHNLFVSELLDPSSPTWIVTPWISDVPIIDNRTAGLRGLVASLPVRSLRLREVLLLQLSHGGSIVIATRPLPANEAFCRELERASDAQGTSDRLLIVTAEQLHEKGIATKRITLSGSMNLTNNGLHHLEERVQLSRERDEIASTALAFEERWGRP